jgi:hypothetical protein
MPNFNLLAATRTIEKSMPFVLYRLLICLGAGLGYLFATLSGAGIAIAAFSLGKNPGAMAPFGAALGFAAFGFLMYKVRPYWLHAVKAPQLALLAEHAKGGALPEGKAQIDHAKQQVARHFPSTAGLFELDQNIQRALAEMPEPPALPAAISQNPQLAKISAWLAGRLSALNHQTILARHFYAGADNPWRTAAEGLAVQHRHFASLRKNRLYASAFEWLGFIAAYPLLLIAFQKLTSGLPVASLEFWTYVFAAVFAWTLKAAFFEPIAEAAMMQSFFPLAEQGADPAQEAELSRRSEAFRTIREKAGS